MRRTHFTDGCNQANRKCYKRSIAGTSSGIRILETNGQGMETSNNKYDVMQTVRINKVNQWLRSSSFDFQALDKSPLFEALHCNETKILGTTQVNAVQNSIVGSSSEKDRDTPNPSVSCKAQANECNSDNECLARQERALSPTLEGHNSATRVYEWDGSVYVSPEETPNQMHRSVWPFSKTKVKSTLKNRITIPKTRRKTNRWSPLEEDTLRAGVLKYGAGNWKIILHSYNDIFQGRTKVDLKDKWRNMT